jgi:2-iminobutanoate/2-iminopropanoate deaminase
MEFFPSHYPDVPFSSAVRVGEVFYLSGNIGLRTDGTLPEGLEAQSRQALDNMVGALTSLGCTTSDVFKCTVMLEDMGRWAEFNRIYLEYFNPARLPARSAYGTNGLALGALVEIECMARVPDLLR